MFSNVPRTIGVDYLRRMQYERKYNTKTFKICGENLLYACLSHPKWLFQPLLVKVFRQTRATREKNHCKNVQPFIMRRSRSK
jgi:hypothetical protein